LKTTILIAILLQSILLFSQPAVYEKGVVTDTLWVNQRSGESFSFYAPESYEAATPSPVIFIFEPGARGIIGIAPFIAAADTYGYVLVCSNNSKNGPYTQNYAIAERLFKKVSSDLNLDPRRVYTSGFSGGARLATSIASGSDQIQGVLSCGAALNLDSGGLPGSPTYSYTVIMGNEDMNYYELPFTRNYLRNIKLPHEIFTDDMNHRWPSADQILYAFDWMQLEAYKNRLIPVDSAIVNKVYHKFLDRAKLKEKNDRLLEAGHEYNRILGNFRRYYNLDSIEQMSITLKQSKSYRAQVKRNETLMETEKMLTYEFLNRFGSDIEKGNFQMSWWENRIGKLKKKQDSKSWMEQKMYSRLLYRIYANAAENANFATYINTADQKRYCFDICILVYPKYPVSYIRQIEIASETGNNELALDYLEKLLATGTTATELLSQFPTLGSLKGNERFDQLMNEQQ